MAQENGAEKIARVFNPLLQEAVKVLKEHSTAQTQEVIMLIQTLDGRLSLLEKLVGDKKKAPRAEKKTAAAADPNAAPVEGAVVQQAANAPKTFPVNKLVFFRDRFKTDAAYRQKYITADMQGLMDKDEQITSKTKEEQKLVAMATWCWNYIKNNQKGVYDAIEKEFLEAKQANEAANKPPQQVAEPATPEGK